MGSTAGIYGEAGHADYASAKSAIVRGLLLSLKNEVVRVAPLGRVNAVCPGWVRTPMADEDMDKVAAERGLDRETAYARANELNPLGRAATPESPRR